MMTECERCQSSLPGPSRKAESHDFKVAGEPSGLLRGEQIVQVISNVFICVIITLVQLWFISFIVRPICLTQQKNNTEQKSF